jgi:hypothetical protein
MMMEKTERLWSTLKTGKERKMARAAPSLGNGTSALVRTNKSSPTSPLFRSSVVPPQQLHVSKARLCTPSTETSHESRQYHPRPRRKCLRQLQGPQGEMRREITLRLLRPAATITCVPLLSAEEEGEEDCCCSVAVGGRFEIPAVWECAQF